MCKGERIGAFFDFERKKGGGPLQLIQSVLSIPKTEAIELAKNFLGERLFHLLSLLKDLKGEKSRNG